LAGSNENGVGEEVGIKIGEVQAVFGKVREPLAFIPNDPHGNNRTYE